jgi:putative transposase
MRPAARRLYPSLDESRAQVMISESTYYYWRNKCGAAPFRHPREENSKLKKIVADVSTDKEMLQDLIHRGLRSNLRV